MHWKSNALLLRKTQLFEVQDPATHCNIDLNHGVQNVKLSLYQRTHTHTCVCVCVCVCLWHAQTRQDDMRKNDCLWVNPQIRNLGLRIVSWEKEWHHKCDRTIRLISVPLDPLVTWQNRLWCASTSYGRCKPCYQNCWSISVQEKQVLTIES